MTGLTEVTLRKVYKELLENWDDLLPSNYTPAVPPERAFPTTVIASGRSSAPKVDLPELPVFLDREKQPEIKSDKPNEGLDMNIEATDNEDFESRGNSRGAQTTTVLNLSSLLWQPQVPFGNSGSAAVLKAQNVAVGMDIEVLQTNPQLEQKMDKDAKSFTSSRNPTSSASSVTRQFRGPPASGSSQSVQYVLPQKLGPGYTELRGSRGQNESENAKQSGDA